MHSPLITALVFLLNAFFNLYILLFLLRIIFRWMRVNIYHEPVFRFIIKLTDPPLQLLHPFIPMWRNIDLAAVLLMFLLKMLLIFLTQILLGKTIGMIGLFIFTFASILSLFLYTFIFSIFISTILSWITPPNSYNPVMNLLYHLNAPLLRPIQRKVPPIEGVDLSPLVAILGLMLINIIIVGYLEQLAISL